MALRKRIERQDVEKLGPNALIWDGVIPGFGVRRQFDAKPRYILKYRTSAGRQRWYTIGKYDAPWTLELARREAMRLLVEVAAGHDPAEEREIERAARVSREPR